MNETELEPKDRLRKARELAGYESPTEAARALRVNKNTYISHENGNRPLSKNAAAQYALKLNTTAGWLLYGERGAPAMGAIASAEPAGAPSGYRLLNARDRKVVDALIASLLSVPDEEKR